MTAAWGECSRGERLALATFVLFICHNPIETAMNFVFSLVNLPGAGVASVLIVFFPLLMSLADRNASERRVIHMGFPALLAFWVFFFLATLTVHPEYASKMFQEGWQYNIIDAFFYPLSGIYAFGVVLACRRTELVSRGLYYAAIVLFLYGVTRFANAEIRGYWEATGMSGVTLHTSYSLGFGYDMLLPTLVFMACICRGFRVKSNTALAVCSSAMILLAGSRGPLGILAVALVAFVIFKVFNQKNLSHMGFFGICLLIVAVLMAALFSDSILTWVADTLGALGVSSRSVDSILNGNFSELNGRQTIYALAESLIEDGPLFGYGLYGDRYYLGPTVYWGYPHNILYELQITFGAIPGLLILVLVVGYVVYAFVKAADPLAREVILILTLQCLSLWISLSYLYSVPFWTLLGFAYMLRVNAKNPALGAGAQIE